MQKLRPATVALFVFAIAASSFGLDSAVIPFTRPSATRRTHRRRGAWNPMFRPSRESMVRQNEEVDRLELPRIQDEAELNELKANHSLVPIVASEYVRFDPRLDPDRRFCRPWTNEFVKDLGEAYYKQFHNSIQVNSAVRTVVVQKKLRRHNRNAAPEKGELASSHLAGITVDIQRRGLSREQVKWMEQYMLPLKNMGLIEPEEERHQWVFHVMVSDRYTEWRDGDTVASEQPEPPAPELQEELARESQIIKSFILGAQ